MEAAFEVTPSDVFGVCVLTFDGEIDIAGADDFVSVLDAVADKRCLVVSLERLHYIDSTGLTALVKEHKRRQARDQRLMLLLPTGQACRVFEMTNLDKVLDCFGDLAEAIISARTFRDGESSYDTTGASEAQPVR